MLKKQVSSKEFGKVGLQKQVFPLFFLLTLAALFVPGSILANHTVLVEGEQDYDGDMMIGMDEDADGDQVFGTLQGGVNGVSDNGRVMVVTSGRFFEQVILQGAGVSVLEAAPGVNAVVEAFNAGDDPAVNDARQQSPGIIINSDGSFPLEIRNIVSRNWTDGIQINGNANVTLDNVRVDSNVNYGIHVQDKASVVVTNSQINSSGFRKSGTLGATPGGDIMPNPGVGIAYEGSSKGFVSYSTIAHSFSDGITANRRSVELLGNSVFNNNLGGDDRGNGNRGGHR